MNGLTSGAEPLALSPLRISKSSSDIAIHSMAQTLSLIGTSILRSSMPQGGGALHPRDIRRFKRIHVRCRPSTSTSGCGQSVLHRVHQGYRSPLHLCRSPSGVVPCLHSSGTTSGSGRVSGDDRRIWNCRVAAGSRRHCAWAAAPRPVSRTLSKRPLPPGQLPSARCE